MDGTTPVLHCIQRAKERYDLDLNVLDLNDIRSDILAGKSLLLRKTPHPNGGEQHAVNYRGKSLILIWLPKEQVIATFLPETARRFGNLTRKKEYLTARRLRRVKATRINRDDYILDNQGD